MTYLSTRYLLALGLAVASVLFLVLAIGALGIVGDGGRPDRLYAAVPLVGLVGAALARLRPRGMSLTLLAMATTQALVSVAALVAVLAGAEGFEGASTVDLVLVNLMYIGLFTASAWLFRRVEPARPAAPGQG